MTMDLKPDKISYLLRHKLRGYWKMTNQKKSQLDIILEVSKKASKDFIKWDRKELLSYLETQGTEALRERLLKDIKQVSNE
jgi:hypothetical protein